MITSIAPVGRSWIRRAVIVLACAGLTALLASLLDIEASPSSHVVAQPAMVPQWVISPAPASDTYREAPVPQQAPRPISAEALTTIPPTAPVSKLPFRFLGKVDAGAETSVVLYGQGRTLTVRAVGPLDDEYVVDSIQEGYLMLRHLPSGTSHMLELASRQHTAVPAGSAAETPLIRRVHPGPYSSQAGAARMSTQILRRSDTCPKPSSSRHPVFCRQGRVVDDSAT